MDKAMKEGLYHREDTWLGSRRHRQWPPPQIVNEREAGAEQQSERQILRKQMERMSGMAMSNDMQVTNSTRSGYCGRITAGHHRPLIASIQSDETKRILFILIEIDFIDRQMDCHRQFWRCRRTHAFPVGSLRLSLPISSVISEFKP